MSIETGLTTLLKENAGIAAFVSSRIYPINLPQNVTYPAITITLEDAMHSYIFGQNQPKIIDKFYQVSAWSLDRHRGGGGIAEVRDIAELLLSALDNYSGTLGGEDVLEFNLESEHESYDARSETFMRAITFRAVKQN